jgi:mxaD protein
MRRAAVCAAIVFPLTLTGADAAAGEIKVKKTLALTGSPDATWSLLADYCSIQQWLPPVAKCEIVKGTTNQPGAVRLLTLQDGGRVVEELTSYDAKKRSYSYKMLEGPLVDYNATLAVLPGPSGGSIVDWQSSFDPAAGGDPAAARARIEGLYDVGLARVKELSGAQ